MEKVKLAQWITVLGIFVAAISLIFAVLDIGMNNVNAITVLENPVFFVLLAIGIVLVVVGIFYFLSLSLPAR